MSQTPKWFLIQGPISLLCLLSQLMSNRVHLATRIAVFLFSVAALVLCFFFGEPLFRITLVRAGLDNTTFVFDYSLMEICHEVDYACAGNVLVAAIIMAFITIVTASIAVILMIPLLVMQIQTVMGKRCACCCKRGLGITHLVFVAINFGACVAALGTCAAEVKTLKDRNPVGKRYYGDEYVVSNETMYGFYIVIARAVAAFIALVLSAIPAAIGIAYSPCCDARGDATARTTTSAPDYFSNCETQCPENKTMHA